MFVYPDDYAVVVVGAGHAGGSPARPPAERAAPTKIAPRKNVPVVMITARAR